MRRSFLSAAAGLVLLAAASGCTLSGERAPVRVEIVSDLPDPDPGAATLQALVLAANDLGRLHERLFNPGLDGAWPAGADEAEIESWLSSHPDDREAFEAPRTAVRRSADGLGLVARPYTEVFAEALGRIAAQLLQAAEHEENATFRRFLRSRARALATGDWAPSERDWLDVRGSEYLAWLGPGEGDDALMGLKAGYAAWVARPVPEEEERLELYAGILPQLEQIYSPVPKALVTAPRLCVVDDLHRTGALKGSARDSAVLPWDAGVLAERGPAWVISRNLHAARAERRLLPAAEMLLQEHMAKEVSVQADLNLLLFHRFAHAVGPMRATGGAADLKEVFGDDHGPLEEAKADLLAFEALQRLGLEGSLPDTWRFQHLPTLVVNEFLTAAAWQAGAEPDSDGRAALVILNGLRERDVLEKRYGRWILRPGDEAPDALLREIIAIQAAGDLDRATLFLLRSTAIDYDLESTFKALAELPRVEILPEFRVRQARSALGRRPITRP